MATYAEQLTCSGPGYVLEKRSASNKAHVRKVKPSLVCLFVGSADIVRVGRSKEEVIGLWSGSGSESGSRDFPKDSLLGGGLRSLGAFLVCTRLCHQNDGMDLMA